MDTSTAEASTNSLGIDTTALVKEYRAKLIAMLTRLSRDPHLAEDLAHDALIAVIKKLEQGAIKDRNKLSSYIFSTARYLYYGAMRRHGSKVELMGAMEDFESLVPVQEEVIESDWQAKSVRRSIESLPKERDRDILLRSYFNDQAKHEICEALLLSNSHYDRVISRARQRLKQITLATQPELCFDF